MAVLTSGSDELRLVRVVIPVARLTVDLSDSELSGFIAFDGGLVALETGRGHMCPFEGVFRIAIVSCHVVLRRRPPSFVVAIVTSDPARCRFECVPVIIEMARCADVGDGMRIGEVARRNSDGYAESLPARVPLDMAFIALHLLVLAEEGEFGGRVVEVAFDRGATYSMPTRGGMATCAWALELAPVFIFVTRFACIELEWRESHHQLTLSSACGLVTVRAFGAQVTAGQAIPCPRVVESIGILPRGLRVTLLAAAAGKLLDVRIILLVAGQALCPEAQQRSV